jgi:Protein of unknown function (DUF1036)
VQVKFRNRHRARVWVAIMTHDPGRCGAYGNWRTQGWWDIQPGQTVHVFNTSYRYAAYYAEGEDGVRWTGPYGPAYIYTAGFDSCINIGSTAAEARVGLRLLDLDQPFLITSFTLNLG